MRFLKNIWNPSFTLMVKFSILIPTFNREKTLKRCIDSVLNQSLKDFEIWVVDDGSIDNTREVMGEIMREDEDNKVNYWRWEKNQERLIAQNFLAKLAKGEWFLFLDSDDEIRRDTLKIVNDNIEKNSDIKLFNWGAVINWADGRITYRETFKPIMIGTGHEEFKSGKIGKGHFIFKRELWQEFGGFPETSTSDSFSRETERLKLQPFYKDGAPMGNPWGDDWFLFYKLTRKNISIPISEFLYIQHIRTDNPHEYRRKN